jgi:hypothetical protein
MRQSRPNQGRVTMVTLGAGGTVVGLCRVRSLIASAIWRGLQGFKRSLRTG